MKESFPFTLLLPDRRDKSHDFEVNGIYYLKNGNNASVTYKGTFIDSQAYDGEVSIPSTVTYNGKTYLVTSIGEWAFRGCEGLTLVNIPNSVTSIGDWAFADCRDLTRMTIPNSVTFIGNMAFHCCSSLTSVTIGNSVTSIGNFAFGGCIGLRSVTIPNSVTSIGNAAFSDCSGLSALYFNAVSCADFNISYPPFISTNISTIIIGNSVQRIPAYFAYYLKSVISVTIGNSVISIGNDAFQGCMALSTLYFNAVFCNDFNPLYHPFFYTNISTIIIGKSVQKIPAHFAYGMKTVSSVTIPNSVAYIEKYSFSHCSGLESVIIPDSVTFIGLQAFSFCCGLKDLYCHISNLYKVAIGSEIFDVWIEGGDYDYSGRTLHVPAGTLVAYRASVWSKYFDAIVEM